MYDQMREASMLLLAQQQVLAAEEAREQASKPKFVPAESEKVLRERQRQRDAASGLLETPPLPKTSEVKQDWAADGLLLATAPGTLSGRTLGIGGLDEELEEIRRRVSKLNRRCPDQGIAQTTHLQQTDHIIPYQSQRFE